MDDKSFDDFFAKKDKSKKKKKGGQKKFTTTDTITKAIHDQQAARKEQEQIEPAQMPSSFLHADDEWIDFKQKEKADFSALNLDDLNISSDLNVQETRNKLDDETQDDSKENDVVAPWQGDTIKQKNLSDNGEQQQQQQQQQQQTQALETPTRGIPDEQTESAAIPKSTGKYIPPALKRALEAKAGGDDQSSSFASKSTEKYIPPSRRRAQELGSDSPSVHSEKSYVVPSRRGGKKMDAPSLNDEVEFPSLTDSKPRESKDSGTAPQRSFEYVRHGGRPTGPADSQPVELDNKYQSLSN